MRFDTLFMMKLSQKLETFSNTVSSFITFVPALDRMWDWNN